MYVDAILSKDENLVRVIERRNGKRVIRQVAADYSFYIPDSYGPYVSIFGDKLAKITPKTNDELMRMRHTYSHKKKFESDTNLVMRCLEQTYNGQEPPDLHIAFYDIETAFDKDLGYSSAEEAFNPITSISIYLDWLDQMVCLAVPPPGMRWADADAIASKVGNTILFTSEIEMLETFISLVEDADVLSGWNSEAYDLPYIINRVAKILGKQEVRRLCVLGQSPKRRRIMRGGKEEFVYDLVGKVSLDYMLLYKKYSYEERASYSLNSICEAELNDIKVPYDGTLDQLYRFDFEKFLTYNIKDTSLLHSLELKLKYIVLTNTIAHDSCVLLPTTMGTVAMIEQAISIEAHRRDMIVPDRRHDSDFEEVYDYGDDDDSDKDRAAGGWVACHSPGLHKWVGSSDLNSLYPSVFRAFNMSPETLIGQVRTEKNDAALREYQATHVGDNFSEWWNDRFNTIDMDAFLENRNFDHLTVDFEDGNKLTITGAELRQLIFDSGEPWCITANGTIFRHDIEGVIPSLFSRWYNERKKMQGIKKNFTSIVEYAYDTDLTDLRVVSQITKADIYDFNFAELANVLINQGPALTNFLSDWGLEIVSGKVVPQQDNKHFWVNAEGYWDKKQLVKKILLNSAYGGVLNAGMKFFDQRIGQSTTLSGRSITKHMTAKTNEMLCGEYSHTGKCVLYNDTDSTYFSAWPEIKDDVKKGLIEWNKDVAIDLYDQISVEVSNTFPEFLEKTFNVPSKYGDVIKSSREIVAETALFIKKKRYAVLLYDKDGNRYDTDGKIGKVKVTGLDLRRSDTPKFVQEFLMTILTDVLKDTDEETVIMKVREFKEHFASLKPWQKGSPKAVNNLTSYREREEEAIAEKLAGRVPKKFVVPGHVRSAINWNYLRGINKDLVSGKIVDGQKIVVCPLKPNDYKFTSIAYPTDELRLPSWFTSLPFDEEHMMNALIDKKLKNMIGILKWDLSRTSKEAEHFESLFSFD